MPIPRRCGRPDQDQTEFLHVHATAASCAANSLVDLRAHTPDHKLCEETGRGNQALRAWNVDVCGLLHRSQASFDATALSGLLVPGPSGLRELRSRLHDTPGSCGDRLEGSGSTARAIPILSSFSGRRLPAGNITDLRNRCENHHGSFASPIASPAWNSGSFATDSGGSGWKHRHRLVPLKPGGIVASHRLASFVGRAGVHSHLQGPRTGSGGDNAAGNPVFSP